MPQLRCILAALAGCAERHPAGRNGRISGNESGQRPAGRRRDSRVIDIASGLPADCRRLRTHARRHCRRGGGIRRRPLLAPPYPAAADASGPERDRGLPRSSHDRLVEARPPAASYDPQEPAGQERTGQKWTGKERASKGACLSQRGPSRAAGARRLRIGLRCTEPNSSGGKPAQPASTMRRLGNFRCGNHFLTGCAAPSRCLVAE